MLILVMVVFLVFLVLGMPIAFCMALSAGAAIVLNPSLPATIVAQKIYTAVDSISFIAIPLFMMAGSLMNSTGITDKIIEFFENLVGHITGGLAHAGVLTGMLMAGVSGSSVADAAAISTIASIHCKIRLHAVQCAVIALSGNTPNSGSNHFLMSPLPACPLITL